MLNQMDYKRGMKVRVKKGSVLWSMKKGQAFPFEAKRSYTVKLHDFYAGGWMMDNGKLKESKVVWPGTGGYWTYASPNDVEVVE